MRKDERGAVFVQVTVCLLALLSISAIVVDKGVMWVSRAQAQNAADAAALAAMQTLTFESAPDIANLKGKAQVVAQQVGLRNKVWGAAPDIQLTDVTFPNCPPTLNWSTSETCVQVDVYRNQLRGNPLPTFFAKLVGVTEQGVRAVAVGRAVAANASKCMKPWAVGDKWLDTQAGGWTQTSTFDAAAGDVYTPPTATDPGTGFSENDGGDPPLPTYKGYQMVLKLANPGLGANEIPVNSAGWAAELDLNNPDANGGQAAYGANITGCTSDTVVMSPPGSGPCTAVDPSKGCLAVRTGSGGATNSKAVADYIAANDPGARWEEPDDPVNGWKSGQIVNNAETPSSRIIPVAVFDVPQYLAQGYTGQNGIIRVVKILGFFLEGTCQTVTKLETYAKCPGGGNDKSAIVGRMVNYPGLSVSNTTTAGSFGTHIVLVR